MHPARFGSLRFRLTAMATVVVAVVLAVSAVTLLLVQRNQLGATFDRSLEERADTLTQAYEADLPDEPLATNDEDRALQLVAVDGTVLAASTNLTGAPPLVAGAGTRPTRDVYRNRADLPLEDDSYRVLERLIDTPAGPAVLLVAENRDDLNEAIRALTLALATTIPAAVLALALIMWWLIGRALTPVEMVRAEVDAITAANSSHRVPVTDRNDEISRLSHTMNAMLDRLADADERQRRFVADAAHELRTPLTRIRTTVEVDLAQPERADPGATNRTVRDETLALQNLIDDLLHLARRDGGQVPLRREPVDLDDIVLTEIAKQRELTPDVAIDARHVSAAHLDANPDHLARAVRNLLTNAARHAETTVCVELRERVGSVELRVEDDGSGVPATDRERIFERFARIDDARARSDGGTGLGLAITRDIVDAHGGTIVCDESGTGGARFVVRIPATHTTP